MSQPYRPPLGSSVSSKWGRNSGDERESSAHQQTNTRSREAGRGNLYHKSQSSSADEVTQEFRRGMSFGNSRDQYPVRKDHQTGNSSRQHPSGRPQGTQRLPHSSSSPSASAASVGTGNLQPKSNNNWKRKEKLKADCDWDAASNSYVFNITIRISASEIEVNSIPHDYDEFNRVLKARCVGNSAEFTTTEGISGDNLAIEYELLKRLKSSIETIKPKCSKHLVDYHNMDTSVTLLVGRDTDLLRFCSGTRSSITSIGDTCNACLLVPLHYFSFDPIEFERELEKLAKPILDTLRESNQKIQNSLNICYHLKTSLKVFDENSSHRPPFLSDHHINAVLVTLTCYVDDNILSLPGGKRELTETPLECAIRECKEETGIDTNEWNLMYHSHIGVNYYWFAPKIVISDDATTAAATMDPACENTAVN